MSAFLKGLLLAALHIAIVGSLGVKLQYDRATRPRVWARAAPVDPNLPIRGRYVGLGLDVGVDPALNLVSPTSTQVALVVRDNRLVAVPSSGTTGVWAHGVVRDGRQLAVLDQPLAYFIPEHVADPSIRQAGEELWVEVTIPRRGAPRPIRLGVKKDGVLTPLELK